MTNPKELTDRYVALWMEPDARARRKAIQELFAADGAHILEPPQVIRDAARALGFHTPTLEVRGHEALEARVARAHEELVAPGQFTFRSRGNAARLNDVVKFNWEMVLRSGGEVARVGLDILVLDGEGKIRIDYQFLES